MTGLGTWNIVHRFSIALVKLGLAAGRLFTFGEIVGLAERYFPPRREENQ
jgi:hypothetical protein